MSEAQNSGFFGDDSAFYFPRDNQDILSNEAISWSDRLTPSDIIPDYMGYGKGRGSKKQKKSRYDVVQNKEPHVKDVPLNVDFQNFARLITVHPKRVVKFVFGSVFCLAVTACTVFVHQTGSLSHDKGFVPSVTQTVTAPVVVQKLEQSGTNAITDEAFPSFTPPERAAQETAIVPNVSNAPSLIHQPAVDLLKAFQTALVEPENPVSAFTSVLGLKGLNYDVVYAAGVPSTLDSSEPASIAESKDIKKEDPLLTHLVALLSQEKTKTSRHHNEYSFSVQKAVVAEQTCCSIRLNQKASDEPVSDLIDLVVETNKPLLNISTPYDLGVLSDVKTSVVPTSVELGAALKKVHVSSREEGKLLQHWSVGSSDQKAAALKQALWLEQGNSGQTAVLLGLAKRLLTDDGLHSPMAAKLAEDMAYHALLNKDLSSAQKYECRYHEILKGRPVKSQPWQRYVKGFCYS